MIEPAVALNDEMIEMLAHKAGLTQNLDQPPMRCQALVNEYSRDLSCSQLQLLKLAKTVVNQHCIIFRGEPTCLPPKKAHLDALQLLSDRCGLHVSVLHRRSRLTQFNQVLSISTRRAVAIPEVNLS